MTACLKQFGTQPLIKELFIIVKILGPVVSRTSLKRREGKMSEGEVLGFMFEIICVKEEREIGTKLLRNEEHEPNSDGLKEGGEI